MEQEYLKKQRIYKTIMLVILTAFLTFILTTIYITNKYGITVGKTTTILNSSSKKNLLSEGISNIKQILEEKYLNEIDENKMLDSAIKGYVAGLEDPYTEYFTKEEMDEYKIKLVGNYVGIGIYMTSNTEKNMIQVLMPIEGSPALEAGILPGDLIVSVDGIKYTAEQMDIAADAIKGKEGTVVTLEIQRDQEIKYYDITRRKVITNPVESKVIKNEIGYIQVTSFDEETAESFKAKFIELQKQGIKSLIIDLRNNGGGLVDSALQIADYIVPKNKNLLITVDKNKKEEIEISKNDILIDMPIIVLVNENSASASEILTGALKDLEEATIVGTTTYGKGVIQEFLTFKDGTGLKVTTHEYFTPNRNKINEKGIIPDEVVELPNGINPLYVAEDNDTQLQKAIELLSK